MKFKTTILAATISATAITGLTSCGDKKADDKDAVLRFSAIPDENTTAQAARYAPIAKFLEKELGVKVEFVASPNYGASVEKFKGGDIQLAWFGGVTGVQARQAVEGAKAIVAGKEDLQFKSYFIANSSTGLTKSESFPAAIADLKFTYGSQNSTSGCIMPTNFIMKETGKGPTEFFSKPFAFSGSHDKTLEQVADGTFQVGALNYTTYDNAVAAGTIDPEKCVVIWETPTYADYNMTAHPQLDEQFGEGFTAKLQNALANCKDEAVLKALSRTELVKVENSTFQGIADVMAKVKFDK